MYALHHCGNALKPHTGINGWFRQWFHGAISTTLVLHKYQVPDLNITIQIIIFAAGRTTGDTFAMIIKNFRTGAAGAGVTHLPKIIFIQTRKTFGTDTHFFQPDIRCFIIGNMYRYPQTFFWQAQYFRQELPGKFNRITLEIITKTKVAQHFKECVVASGVTHVFQIIMLAACTHTALR